MPLAPSYLPTTYAQALRLVESARDKRVKPVGNNTTVERLGGSLLGIRYHNTIIVSFDAEGRVHLTSGGYRTATTKARLAYVASAYGYRLSQRDWQWYLTTPEGTEVPWEDGVAVGRTPVSA